MAEEPILDKYALETIGERIRRSETFAVIADLPADLGALLQALGSAEQPETELPA